MQLKVSRPKKTATAKSSQRRCLNKSKQHFVHKHVNSPHHQRPQQQRRMFSSENECDQVHSSGERQESPPTEQQQPQSQNAPQNVFQSMPNNSFPTFDALLDIDDFFRGEPTHTTYTPQTIHTAPMHITPHVITLVTKECCTLCIPAKDSITRLMTQYPDVFHYMEVDLDDEQNLDWRGRYKYTIPVVLVNNEKFSNKAFTPQNDQDLEEVVQRLKMTNESKY